MKKQTLLALCLSAAFIFSAFTMAAEDKLPQNVMPISKALENLQDKGYSIVRKIEYGDGLYTAEAINAEGKQVKVKVNSQTGDIMAPKESHERMSALEVAKKVEQAGYKDIYKIDTKWFREKYEVKAHDKEGKKVDLEVDAKSGEVEKS